MYKCQNDTYGFYTRKSQAVKHIEEVGKSQNFHNEKCHALLAEQLLLWNIIHKSSSSPTQEMYKCQNDPCKSYTRKSHAVKHIEDEDETKNLYNEEGQAL